MPAVEAFAVLRGLCTDYVMDAGSAARDSEAIED